MKAPQMDPSLVSELAGQWGPMGLLVGYLVWDKWTAGKDNKERREADRKERQDLDTARLLHEREVLDYNKARLDADKAMSAALASLTTAILRGNDHG